MNTSVKSLQDLYVKLGGALTDTYETIANGIPVSDYTTIPDMIEAVTQKSGEKELPEVAAEDAGKVLMVDEQGVWNPAEASGGGNFVRKTLKEVTVNFPNAGWNIEINYFKIPKSEIPEDYICFAGVRCNTSNNTVYSIVIRTTGYDTYGNISIGYHISVYREEALSTFGNTFVFEYFAKA